MDTSWMSFSRASTEYEKGLDEFLDFIFSTEGVDGQITCPCIKCRNKKWVDREEAKIHLICDGFIKGYRIAPCNSKTRDTPMLDAEDDMQGLVHDAFHGFGENIHDNEPETVHESQSLPNTNAKKFYKVLEDAKKELYPGCKKFSVLSFIVRLFHIKCIGKCNDKGFSMMLDTLREAFPDASIPKSLYELRKIIRELGLTDVETIHNKTSRNYDEGGYEDVLPIFSMSGRPIGATGVEALDHDTLSIAHSYVLFNCSEVDEFRTEHLIIVRRENRKLREREIQRLHSETFESWFEDHVEKLHTAGDERVTEDLRNLASGPAEFAMTNSFSSARDNNPIVGDVTYYGVLNDIIELQYGADKKVVLFRCDWISNGSRMKEDENGFTLLNFEGLKPDNEPFILASQAQQVFYVADRVDKGWKVVIKTTPRDSYDMNEQECPDDVEAHLQSETSMGPHLDENMNIELVRGDLNGTIIDQNSLLIDGDEDLSERGS
ncbi:hypothetical protein SSX86_001786 [Deinandra increscens subsp. villosa]|uniref:Transposase n=1 Tax=Deinandra increscens subsp. villosa TaxID=3103831 RepID=A0AAP0DS19_9ASTR